MKCFLAYFDLLGYKRFIENNSTEQLNYRTDHFARNIERALSMDGRTQQTNSGRLIYDISYSTLNCLTFSDTVIFWTNDAQSEDFEEIIRVAFQYNNFNVMLDFPNRGCVVYGEIAYKPFESNSLRGGRYMLNMIYGQALIDAYEKAEAMSWAGCVIDTSALAHASTLGNFDALLDEHTLSYDVPYKSKDGNEVRRREVALRLIKGEVLISEHYEKSIRSAFTQDNKGEITGRVAEIFNNTIRFFRRHCIRFPLYYHHGDAEGSKETFGRLQSNWMHTIVMREAHPGEGDLYRISEETFDPNRSDRLFLDYQRTNAAEFDCYFLKAARATNRYGRLYRIWYQLNSWIKQKILKQ